MEDYKIKLKECIGNQFFETLEKHLNSKIPVTLKNVLIFNRYDSASALSEFNDDSVEEVQDCMRNVFDKEMLDHDENVADYLGKFVKVQIKFILLSGELKLIKRMAETCRRLYVLQPEENPIQSNENEMSADRPADNNLFNVIGSHMITVFNDALRITLSGWSWPSRYVASEKANDFKFGRESSSNINLQYVTPVNHAEFLNCIVMSDIENFKICIRESLAMSLRVDGSVDRTQHHNVFAMIQIVKKDATIGTLCIGFDVPKSPGAAGYLICLKNVVSKVLTWDEFFGLITSIVTDGESLNTGRLNGLVAKLKNLRDLCGTNLPLLSIWCVPHRTNLAWKSVSLINIIASLISRATKLSKHFHDSGKRTQKLKTAAALNTLSPPLKYPSFHDVRWIEFVFNLFNAILRNWRASIEYFKAENLQGQLNYWTQYDTLHSITFLTDVLGLLKRFQKSCQSDTITLIEVSRLSDTLFEELDCFKVACVAGGWEDLFLRTVVTNGNDVSFYGSKLETISGRRTRKSSIIFTQEKRKHIVESMERHLKIRLKLDAPLLKAFEPFEKLSSATSQESLQLCFNTIATDLEEDVFITEYYSAAELLKNQHCKSTLETLQILVKLSPDNFTTIKTVMARIAVAKPHSADVERLINVYNKFKTPDRSSISQLTLSNYLYVNTNMGTLEKFDPKPAVHYWLKQKNRHAKSNDKSHLQEWFHGVFEQPLDIQKKNNKLHSIIRF